MTTVTNLKPVVSGVLILLGVIITLLGGGTESDVSKYVSLGTFIAGSVGFAISDPVKLLGGGDEKN